MKWKQHVMDLKLRNDVMNICVAQRSSDDCILNLQAKPVPGGQKTFYLKVRT